MTRWLTVAFRAATLVLAAISLAALLPFLGRPSPAFGQLGGGLGGFCSGIGGIGNLGGFGLGGCTFGSGFSGVSQFGGGGFGSFSGFGNFVAATPEPAVTAGESLPLVVAWAVPEPASWRDLRALEVRIRNRGRVALWLRWDERSNTLAQVDPATGRAVGRHRRPGGGGTFGTGLATLDVAAVEVEDSGPGGDAVALLLPVTFTPAAAGRAYLVEMGADHDDGQVFFGTVGRIAVRR